MERISDVRFEEFSEMMGLAIGIAHVYARSGDAAVGDARRFLAKLAAGRAEPAAGLNADEFYQFLYLALALNEAASPWHPDSARLAGHLEALARERESDVGAPTRVT